VGVGWDFISELWGSLPSHVGFSQGEVLVVFQIWLRGAGERWMEAWSSLNRGLGGNRSPSHHC